MRALKTDVADFAAAAVAPMQLLPVPTLCTRTTHIMQNGLLQPDEQLH